MTSCAVPLSYQLLKLVAELPGCTAGGPIAGRPTRWAAAEKGAALLDRAFLPMATTSSATKRSSGKDVKCTRKWSLPTGARRRSSISSRSSRARLGRDQGYTRVVLRDFDRGFKFDAVTELPEDFGQYFVLQDYASNYARAERQLRVTHHMDLPESQRR